jgi:ribose-phosphate pyrophosphokinase
MRLFSLDPDAAYVHTAAQEVGLSPSPHEFRDFGGGEHKGRPLVPVRNDDVAVVCSLHPSPGASANDKLVRLAFFIATCRDHGASSVTAICPYLPYARKDWRTKPFDPVGARYVAQVLEAAGASCVATLEVHNPAAFDTAFRIPTIRLDARPLFAARIEAVRAGRRFTLVSPDIGGFKRVQLLADLFENAQSDAPTLAVCEKRRSGGVLSGGLFAGDVASRPVWIVDDMIVGGGTMKEAVARCRDHDAAEVHLMATHALMTPDTVDSLLEAGADSITVTSSVAPFADDFTGRHGLTILDIAPILADCLREVMRGPA